MPELPDILLYVARLNERLCGSRLDEVVLGSPFVLKTTDPPIRSLEGLSVQAISRLGKRLVFQFENDKLLVIHLMISGRLQWVTPSPPAKPVRSKAILAIFRFQSGQLTLVENSTKKRASIWVLPNVGSLAAMDRAGLNVLDLDARNFHEMLVRERRTLKRALTDPGAFDGIGNAYSDEILFAARLAPTRLTTSLTSEESNRLLSASQNMLRDWTDRLQSMYPSFPKPSDVTAFRPEFSVHGRYGQPCRTCHAPVQRIVYAENETNYCAVCQNEGRLLADRSLSRLLKDDWPKMLRQQD